MSKVKVMSYLMIMIVIFSGCAKVNSQSANTEAKEQKEETGDPKNEGERVIDTLKLMQTMFPDKVFEKQGKMYHVDERENYYIDRIMPGSFVNENQDELLVVVKRPWSEPPHAAGLDLTYMAIFNQQGTLISEVKSFMSDLVRYWILDHQGLSYIWYVGSTTYQDWTDFDGGLFKAGNPFAKIWPKDATYFENKAVAYDKMLPHFNVFERKILPTREDRTIPKYTWEYAYTLSWNEEEGTFMIIDNIYEMND